MPGTVQLLSASPIEPVASSTNITFSGWALPPALVAVAVELSVKESTPERLQEEGRDRGRSASP